MRWPKTLLRHEPYVHKNGFGHVLVLAGSPSMLGAAALTGLAGMRTGAGLVTCGVPKSLNLTLQKKISPVIMTLPLPETNAHMFALSAYQILEKHFGKFDAVAIGPGMGQNPGTQRFILKVIARCPKPLVIDADALNALAKHPDVLSRSDRIRILTPHPGEMGRLMGIAPAQVEENRKNIAVKCAQTYNSIVLLKGYRSVIASPQGKAYINHTGNAGMATAGSGDVLTGMIAALLGQGVPALEAARFGAYMHGKAGDLAAKNKTRAAMIANDIIEHIPGAFLCVMKK